MKYTLILFCVLVGMIGCKDRPGTHPSVETNPAVDSLSQTVNQAETNPAEEAVLVGKHPLSTLRQDPYHTWFDENYSYSPQDEIIKQLQPALTGVEMTVFMGTWCSDSQQHVPVLVRILEAANYDLQKITLIAVDEDKKTPENWEEDHTIEYVPTIILWRHEKELGRIVEYPMQTLEEDLLKIVTGQPYKHAYQE